MYDRYTISSESAVLEKAFGIKLPQEFKPSYNAAPTQKLPVVILGSPESAQLFQWGFIGNMSNNRAISPKLINIPASNGFQRPAYRKMFENNRCVILCDGFYAWKQIGKKQMAPYFVYFDGNAPFGIAGVWEEYESLDGKAAKSFNMITVSSTDDLRSYQDDMPAILSADGIEKWMQKTTSVQDLEALMKEISSKNLRIHPVSPLLSNVKLNDDRLIKPASPSDQFGNYTLFS